MLKTLLNVLFAIINILFAILLCLLILSFINNAFAQLTAPSEPVVYVNPPPPPPTPDFSTCYSTNVGCYESFDFNASDSLFNFCQFGDVSFEIDLNDADNCRPDMETGLCITCETCPDGEIRLYGLDVNLCVPDLDCPVGIYNVNTGQCWPINCPYGDGLEQDCFPPPQCDPNQNADLLTGTNGVYCSCGADKIWSDSQQSCIECPAGAFYSDYTDTCTICPEGTTFQPENGQCHKPRCPVEGVGMTWQECHDRNYLMPASRDYRDGLLPNGVCLTPLAMEQYVLNNNPDDPAYSLSALCGDPLDPDYDPDGVDNEPPPDQSNNASSDYVDPNTGDVTENTGGGTNGGGGTEGGGGTNGGGGTEGGGGTKGGGGT